MTFATKLRRARLPKRPLTFKWLSPSAAKSSALQKASDLQAMATQNHRHTPFQRHAVAQLLLRRHPVLGTQLETFEPRSTLSSLFHLIHYEWNTTSLQSLSNNLKPHYLPHSSLQIISQKLFVISLF